MENLEAILARMRAVLGVKTDKQMCEILEIQYGTLDNWKNRKKIPRGRLLEIATKLNVTPEYLESGINISGGNNQIGNSNIQNNGSNEKERGEIWSEFVRLFDEYGSNAMLRKFIERLEEEKEKFTKGE
ncbi:helix-turn-helix domain-containing protein [Campylobacter concisus]|jgi:bacteriophage CI repressor helix-turn-helix domain|uniref:helix-turn-helix domain-containing protein n=1 Tax=Campylobacter concisus TaxID=199 RepID=UPI00040DDD8E|nr:helix-turn-helix domain-containing protein [Campylobacter concisus]DAW80153.1 MAG TPA: CI repressor [Caudoviricetes sp.]